MDITSIIAPVEDDLIKTDAIILEQVKEQVPFVYDIGCHIIQGGGKRIRPLVALLTARACDYSGQDHITLAAVIEFLHTVTLLHDDVVDQAKLRRGQKTANHVWGNTASVLVGDFLIARVFQMVVKLGHLPVLQALAEVTQVITAGELYQLSNCRNPDTTADQYRAVIYRKTAKMFEFAARTGPLLMSVQATLTQSLIAFGKHLGMAFQLTDDIMDYAGDEAATGKALGNDLVEGKLTLPLIHALRQGSDSERKLIKKAIQNNGEQYLTDIQTILDQTGALDYTRQMVQQELQQARTAIELLPNSEFREALITLTYFVDHRIS